MFFRCVIVFKSVILCHNVGFNLGYIQFIFRNFGIYTALAD